MGKFVISKRVNGDYQFRLHANNGQAVLSSEGYQTLASCQNGIASVRTNSQHSERFCCKISPNGKLYFCLKEQNNRIIGQSEMYENESAMANGVVSVMKNAPDAEIENEVL